MRRPNLLALTRELIHNFSSALRVEELLDNGYRDEAGIHTFPTTGFVDRYGRIVFIKVGWTQKLAEEFSWRIEAL